jgi:hypothetical protein
LPLMPVAADRRGVWWRGDNALPLRIGDHAMW